MAVDEYTIRALFTSYASCFNSDDTLDLEEFFSIPVTVGHAKERIACLDQAGLRQNLEDMLAGFRERGVTHSSPMVRKIDIVGESGLAAVDWTQMDNTGKRIREVSVNYHMIRINRKWKIAMVVTDSA